MGEQEAEVAASNHAVTIQIAIRGIWNAPERKKATEICAVDVAVKVQVAVQQFARIKFVVLVLVFGPSGKVALIINAVRVAVNGVS